MTRERASGMLSTSSPMAAHDDIHDDTCHTAFWNCRHRSISLRPQSLIMGILNVTPDSFSDGGKWSNQDAAIAHAHTMIEAGAGIIDIGGESTRPGAAPVDTKTEIARTAPVIAAIRTQSDIPLSIDTSKAAVAAAALDAGADIVNDVTALEGDPAMAATVAQFRAGLVLMHMRGEPRTMQKSPTYTDVVAEITAYLIRQTNTAIAAGIDPTQIVIDPGIGFGKTLAHNLSLLRNLRDIRHATKRPLLLGVSRKSFITKILGQTPQLLTSPPPHPKNRDWPTVALTAYAREQGVEIIRVHDVLRNAQALRMSEAILTTEK